MRVSPGFVRFVLDQLQELGGVSARSMFGGTGLYQDDVFFGIIARDVLYLKVDDTNRADFVAAGSRPFQPYPDRAASLRYYAVPLGVLESAADLCAWARRACLAEAVRRRHGEGGPVAAGRRSARRARTPSRSTP